MSHYELRMYLVGDAISETGWDIGTHMYTVRLSCRAACIPGHPHWQTWILTPTGIASPWKQSDASPIESHKAGLAAPL